MSFISESNGFEYELLITDKLIRDILYYRIEKRMQGAKEKIRDVENWVDMEYEFNIPNSMTTKMAIEHL